VVVDGQLRIFTDMYEAQTKLLGLENPTPAHILQALVLKAQEGAFDDLHPAVEKITVLSEAPPSVINAEEGDEGDNGGNLQGNGDGSNNLALGLSLAVVAALLVAAAAVTYRRRQRNNEQDETESYQQVEQINSLAPPPSSVV